MMFEGMNGIVKVRMPRLHVRSCRLNNTEHGLFY